MERGSDTVTRQAARVLVVDAAERILLLRGRDPAQPAEWYWFTPGGGLEPGESPAHAAARELYEETSLAIPADRLGAPVFSGVVEFGFDGRRYRQRQDFFLLRVDAWQPVVARFDTIEHAAVDANRWWSVTELEATDDRYYPEDLPARLRELLGRTASAGH